MNIQKEINKYEDLKNDFEDQKNKLEEILFPIAVDYMIFQDSLGIYRDHSSMDFPCVLEQRHLSGIDIHEKYITFFWEEAWSNGDSGSFPVPMNYILDPAEYQKYKDNKLAVAQKKKEDVRKEKEEQERKVYEELKKKYGN